MSSGHKTLTVFLTVIVGLLLTILNLCLHWPLWTWPVMATLLPVTALTAAKVSAPSEEFIPRECRLAPDIPVAEPERREQRVTAVSLPSSEADYDFLLSATVLWRPLEAAPDAPPVSHSGLAVSAILHRAGQITANQPPRRSALAQHQLNGVLGVMKADATGRVLAMAEDVTLTLSDADAARLKKLSTVRKDTVLWEHERKYECDRRTYLGQDVLKDTGSAVVWWLTKNEDEVKKTVDDIGLLAQLSSAANNREIPDLFEHMVPYPVPTSVREQGPPYDSPPDQYGNGHEPMESPEAMGAERFGAMLASLGIAPDDAESAFLAQQWAQLLGALGHGTAADAIRTRFDIPAPSGMSPDATDDAEDAGDAGKDAAGCG